MRSGLIISVCRHAWQAVEKVNKVGGAYPVRIRNESVTFREQTTFLTICQITHRRRQAGMLEAGARTTARPT
jgi:hypothetical protein